MNSVLSTRAMPSNAPDEPAVLVVEDEEDILELVCELIRMEVGCRVYAAKNGQEAINVLRGLEGRRPCLILLDWMMPVMSGADVMQYLREDDVLASIPVMVVTAAPRVEAPGAARIFRKPVSMDALLDIVREHTSRRGGAGGSGEPPSSTRAQHGAAS
jgi:two-component system chemotaxis response regulator CheY